LLVHSISDARIALTNKLKENLHHKEIKDLEQSIYNLESKYVTEKTNIDYLTNRLSIFSNIFMFITKLGECIDLTALSDCIGEIVPQVLKVNSAVLLLGNLGRYNDSFRAFISFYDTIVS
jgi:predicted RNase H-like nuclease (RuvC/YqgF family)